MSKIETDLSPEIQLEMLKTMLKIRYFEMTAGSLYKRGLLKGGVHACIGQEAIPVGISAHLRTDDYITSTHRGHGHHIAKGADVKRLMAELMGKETGYCKGRGGSMHVAAFEVGSLGAFPIVAAGVPCAVGAAFSMMHQGKDQVAVAYFGDGALGQGTIYEAFNLASVLKLPVVFVCENNCFAVSTRTEATVALKDIPSFAASFGFTGVRENGQDVLNVYKTARAAITRARENQGPTLLYFDTYRFEGHYFGEPEIYRTREEVQKSRDELDPIDIFSAYLLDAGMMNKQSRDEIEISARAEIEEAIEFAKQSPDPNPEEFAKYVYA
ncbi:MAG: thiamine pyrophosphate-dependent dehydrogenase E1 component subunit alpha [Anaerolineales bacterium]|nr:thiamine pyrophosphate-dependent dehydrogenase E1 component subunit alpha [Anaerolineales bacterium]